MAELAGLCRTLNLMQGPPQLGSGHEVVTTRRKGILLRSLALGATGNMHLVQRSLAQVGGLGSEPKHAFVVGVGMLVRLTNTEPLVTLSCEEPLWTSCMAPFGVGDLWRTMSASWLHLRPRNGPRISVHRKGPRRRRQFKAAPPPCTLCWLYSSHPHASSSGCRCELATLVGSGASG